MLTQRRLKELLSYDPITGVFIWKVAGHKRKVGSVAGTSHRGGWKISVDGTSQMASRLAYLWMTGDFPKHRIYRLDGNNDSASWDNLAEMNGLVGATGKGNHHTGPRDEPIKPIKSTLPTTPNKKTKKPPVITKTGPGSHRYQHAKYVRDMKCRHQLELIDTQISELAVQRIAVLEEMAVDVEIGDVVPKRDDGNDNVIPMVVVDPGDDD